MDAETLKRIAKLDDVLKQLPREYQNQPRLRHDVATLLKTCSTLQPQVASFSAGGRCATFFYLSGVLPIAYDGSTYNIPVTIYFDPPYPTVAPRCFVTPTSGMAFKQGHQYVDSGGMVYVPALSNWNQRASSLYDLVASMTRVFSESPPVYALASGAAVSSEGGGLSSLLGGLFSSITPAKAAPAQSQYVPPYVAQPVRPTVTAQPVAATVVATPVVARPKVSAKEAAVKSVTEKARHQWPVVLRPIVDEVNSQLKKKVELKELSEHVEAEIASLRQDTARNAQHEAELKAMENELRTVVQACSEDLPDADRLLETLDDESFQVLDSLAEEMALEEFLVALDELLSAGRLGIEDFLREVRDVSRRQFMCRLQRQKAADCVASGLVSPSSVANGEQFALASAPIVDGVAYTPAPHVVAPVHAANPAKRLLVAA